MDYIVLKRERERDYHLQIHQGGEREREGFIACLSCRKEREILLVIIDSLNISIRHGFHSCRWIV
jgi:hypothetical protein